MSDFSFIDVYTEAEDEGYGPSEELGVGKHDAEIKLARTGTTKAGAFKISFMFANDDGTIWMNQSLASEASKPFFAKAMQALGITGAMLDADPDAAVATAVGQRWNITVKESKSNSDFKNVYLNRRLGDSSVEAATASGPAPDQSSPAPAAGTWDI